MSIELKALDVLDADLVDQQSAEMTARLQEYDPSLDLRLGVFQDILVSYNGMLGAQRQDQINQYLRGRSLLDIEADPDLADQDLVDAVLSNFRLTRLEGSLATGEVTVVMTSSTTVTVAQGSVWVADGREFVTPRVFTAKLESEQINDDGDRLLTQTSTGTWAFTIILEAVEPGTEWALRKNTVVVPAQVPTGFLTAVAASDFTGGTAAETNAELLDRFQEGVAARAPSNRVNMRAMLRAESDFAGVVTSSVIGYGDAEQLRDRHWIFPVSGGGRADWYIRTQDNLYHLTMTKTAVLVEVTAGGVGVWQLSFGHDEAPGFYEITDIRPTGAVAVGGFTVSSDTRANDLTGTGFIPDVVTVAEGAYTRFQTAVVRFNDTDTDVAGLIAGATAEYDVTVSCLPLIGAIQDFVSSREISHHAADVLIKAPVPCFVGINFDIHKRSGETDPDLAAIRAALCTEVNSVGFIGRLDASRLTDVVHNYLTNDQTVSAIDLIGRIRYPGGAIVYLRNSETMTVPDDPANMVTARTVQFFVDPEDIGITVRTTVPANT